MRTDNMGFTVSCVVMVLTNALIVHAQRNCQGKCNIALCGEKRIPNGKAKLAYDVAHALKSECYKTNSCGGTSPCNLGAVFYKNEVIGRCTMLGPSVDESDKGACIKAIWEMDNPPEDIYTEQDDYTEQDNEPAQDKEPAKVDNRLDVCLKDLNEAEDQLYYTSNCTYTVVVVASGTLTHNAAWEAKEEAKKLQDNGVNILCYYVGDTCDEAYNKICTQVTKMNPAKTFVHGLYANICCP